MSNEPGLSLGRLVAAERNAASAHDIAKRLEGQVADLSAQLENTKACLAQAEALIAALNSRTAQMIGTGATSGA